MCPTQRMGALGPLGSCPALKPGPVCGCLGGGIHEVEESGKKEGPSRGCGVWVWCLGCAPSL